MEKKFNKANVSDLIQDEINRLENDFKFNPCSGAMQVKGRNENTHIAYGRYTALLELYDDIFGNDKTFVLIP